MKRLAVDGSTLTQWIALASPQSVSDGQGGYIESLMPLTPPNDWAAIQPASATSEELPLAGTVVSSVTHQVQLRYRGDVDIHTQITFEDWARQTHRLYVRAVQNLQQQSELLQVWCEEQTPTP